MSRGLVAQGVVHTYPTGFQLGPVDLLLQPGKIVALLGMNGAGKTTLMRLLAGFFTPQQGQILWNGESPTLHTLRQTVALAPTDAAFPPRATVLDLLRLRADHLGVDSEPTARELQRVLGRPLTSYPSQLSRGQRLQVVLRLALLGNPPVLLADEPWAGLDPLAQEECVKLLAERGNQAAVLLSSHDLGNLAEVAHEFVFLHEGCVRFRGPLEAVVATVGPRFGGTAALKQLFRQVVEKEIG